MFSIIRNLVIVALVSSLIWLFAEAESLRSVPKTIDVLFYADAKSDRTIDVREGGPGSFRVTLEVEGSAAAIDAADQVFQHAVVFSPGMEAVPREPGEYMVSMQDALRAHPALRALGITFRKINPPEVKVIVDEVETRQLKVAAVIDPEEVDGAVEVRPPTVTVRTTRTEAKMLTEASTAQVKIDAETLRSLVRGRRQSIPNVVVSLPPEMAATVHSTPEPRLADVSFTLRLQTGAVKLATVPVHVRLAPGELGKWDIDIPEQERFFTDVTLTGPLESIRNIENKTTPIVATLVLSFEELEKGIVSKEAEFIDLPPGVKADAANKTVRLSIKRRAVEKKPQ